MELLVFDLDGTLLGKDSRISKFTGDTLSMLRERGIRYTAATGRTLHAADSVLNGHYFNAVSYTHLRAHETRHDLV